MKANTKIITEKDKLKMLGKSSESMKINDRRVGKNKTGLQSIIEHVEQVGSDSVSSLFFKENKIQS